MVFLYVEVLLFFLVSPFAAATTFPFSVCYKCPRLWILAIDEFPAGKLTMLCDANVHGVSTYTMSCQQILPEGCRCCWFCCVDSTEAKQARLLHTCKSVSGVQQEHSAIASVKQNETKSLHLWIFLKWKFCVEQCDGSRIRAMSSDLPLPLYYMEAMNDMDSEIVTSTDSFQCCRYKAWAAGEGQVWEMALSLLNNDFFLLPSLNHKEFSVKEVHNKLCISDPQNDPGNVYCLIDGGTGVTFELCSGAREFPLLGFYFVLFCCCGRSQFQFWMDLILLFCFLFLPQLAEL